MNCPHCKGTGRVPSKKELEIKKAIKIQDAGFCWRTIVALSNKAGIKTLGELCDNWTESRLRGISNFGIVSLKEVKKILELYGLELKKGA